MDHHNKLEMHNTPHTEESIQKMRDANKGKHYSPKTQFKKGQPAHNKGVKGVVKDSEKTRMKKSEVLKGNTRNLGKLRSEETKKRLRGKIAWNKDSIGVCKPNKTSFTRERSAGDKNVNWKGGITPVNFKIRNSLDGLNWKREVKKRDGWECQRCPEKRHKKVTAHHILNFSNHPDLRLDLNNGITFCYPCHKAFHMKYGVKNNSLEQVKEFISSFNTNII